MTSGLQISVGAFSQPLMPGAGDVDDCWCTSDLQCVHACAPWLALPTIPAWREAAGNPDRPGPTGGTIEQSAQAIRGFYPRLAIEVLDTDAAVAFAAFANKLKAETGRIATVELLSGALPPALRFGFLGTHRCSVWWQPGTGWRMFNPLQPAHQRALELTEDELRTALRAHAEVVHAIVFPLPTVAIKGHPSYVALELRLASAKRITADSAAKVAAL